MATAKHSPVSNTTVSPATKRTITIQQPPSKSSNLIHNVQFESNAEYRLMDRKGNFVKNPTTKVVDGDLWVYFEDNASAVPDVIFHGYDNYAAVIDVNAGQATSTFSTVDMSAPKAATASSGGYLGKALLGTALIGGVAAAAGGGSDSPSASAPTTAPTVSISIDPISPVNQAASLSPITLSGTFTTANATSTVITVTINGTDYPATITGNTWNLTVDGSVLAHSEGDQTISVAITASNAIGTASDSQDVSYFVDTMIQEPVITIDNITADNIINITESGSATTAITGAATNTADGDTITFTIGQEVYTSTVFGGAFTIDIPTTALLGTDQIIAEVEIFDDVSNTAIGTATHSYVIDITAPTPTLTLNDITDNNTIDLQEVNLGQAINITGTVQGEYSSSDEVIVTVGTEVFQSSIDTTGGYSVSVPVALLAGNATPSVTASITATDQAGNQSAQTTTTKSYAIETAPVVQAGDLSVTLDTITTDNLINVTEVNSQITITGTVTGADKLSTGQTVDLSLNGVALQSNITVDSNGQFRTTVSGEQLAHSQNYTLTAHATGNNNAVATTSKQYTVSANVAAKIDITAISDGFDTTFNKADEMVRITGKALFEGNYASTGDHTTKTNAQLVRQVEVKIGDQTYTAGVRHGEFYIDIKQSELAKLQGETLSYTFKAEPWFFDTRGYNGIARAEDSNAYINVKASSVVINGDHTATANGVTTINTIEANTSSVSGVVSGSAKAGDTIEITVNDSTYHTTVNADKTFSVAVKNSDLVEGDIISAVLNTTDLAGNAITLSDTEMLAVAIAGVADFVSYNNPHHSDDYFVKQLDTTKSIPSNEDPARYDLSIYGVPFGGTQDGSTPVITYYFGDSTSYNAHRLEIYGNSARTILHENTVANYPESIKEIVRNSYTQIANYTNVEFREVNTYEAADVKLYYMNFTEEGTLAFAYYDGNIAWNANSNIQDDSSKYYTALHEISHTFGMEHSSDGLTGSRASEESSEFTYMSYRSYVNNSVFEKLKNLRIYDLAVLHFHLGVNQTARAGDDTYTFQDYDMFSGDAGRYIWDGGGMDTFDASAETVGVTVDLTPGSWIYAGQKSDNFLVKSQTVHTGNFADTDFYYDTYTVSDYTKGQAYIGYGTQIENLIGSDYADTLTGNNANNTIHGGAGDDTINGGAGDDHLDGGTGADTLTGGTGNDIYIVDNVRDLVIEATDEGIDIVYSSVDYTLASNVEHLALIGTAAKNATGNELDNILFANNIGNTLNGGAGDDRLVGGLGADTLTGGAGDDLFLFNAALNGTIDTITDFMQAGNDTLVLASDVFTSLSQGMSNVLDFISYDNTTGVLSYDGDTASGIVDAIAFANIGTGIVLQESHFTII